MEFKEGFRARVFAPEEQNADERAPLTVLLGGVSIVAQLIPAETAENARISQFCD